MIYDYIIGTLDPTISDEFTYAYSYSGPDADALEYIEVSFPEVNG